MIRNSADWMVIWDDRILEIIAKYGPSTPTKISNREEILVSTPHISNRLNGLAKNNLLDPLGNGVYSITEEGRGYLLGAYCAQKQEWVNNDERFGDGLSAIEYKEFMLSNYYNDLYGFPMHQPDERY